MACPSYFGCREEMSMVVHGDFNEILMSHEKE
jgi:hypothetical protein